MHKIHYPIYIISEEPEEIDGLLLIGDQIVDDKNMPGETLGLRRLQTPMKSKYPLRYQIDDEIGMMKHRGKHFIDSNGVVVVFWFKDVPFPFIEARPPETGMSWAGILYKKGIPWKIWEFCEEKKKDTWRKI